MRSSLKTRENKQILVIGNYGIEKRKRKWKVKGLGEATGRQFTVWEETPGKWKVNGIDSAGSRKRERFPARDLSEAVEQAARILYGGFVQSGHPQLRLSDAFLLAISESGGSPEHKKDYEDFAGYFCDWAERRGIFYWHELRYEHAKGYMNDCLGRGLVPKTVSHYLEPIRMTARFMAANHPEYYRDFCTGLRLPTNVGCNGEYDEDDGVPALLFEEAFDFFEFLEDYHHGAVLQPAVLLMAFAGFQLREALRLQNREVDPVLGTAIIQAHPELGEVVKNKYRIRKIPLPQIFLRYHAAHPNDHRNVVPYNGDDKAFGKLLKRALLAWRADCPIAPKDLRNTLPTHALERASEEGWNIYLVDRYIGHAPKSVMERHYFGDKKKRMVEVFREVSDRIDQVVDRIRGGRVPKKAQKGTIRGKGGEKTVEEKSEKAQKGTVVSLVPFFRRDSDAKVT